MYKTIDEFGSILFGAEISGRAALQGLQDTFPCGGAWLNTSGNSQIAKLFKKYAIKQDNGDYVFGEWHMNKGYPSGYSIHHYSSGGSGYQSMEMDIAKYSAIQKSLVEEGIGETNLYSYID